MAERLEADICIIGAGSGGLTVAAGAARLGQRTVLFERDRMGGECLNNGCVPSKALLAAAKAAKAVRQASRFGIRTAPPEVDFAQVRAQVQAAIASIAPHDSVERFEGLGVRVIRAEARFAGPREVEGGGVRVRARRIVIATGSKPVVPPVPGLEAVPYFTNETLFDNPVLPGHLVVVGGGPVGIEMAQAHALLGSRVTLIETGRILARSEPEMTAILRAGLERDGVAFREGSQVVRVEQDGPGVAAVVAGASGEERIGGSHLLVATGRRPNVAGLDLERAGISVDPVSGLQVDARLRTSNRRVYAVGDAAGAPFFTHRAGYQGGIVIRNALFRLPARADRQPLPAVTYTDPELASAGLTEAEARAAHGEIKVLRADFRDNDRAVTEGETEGRIKIIARRNGKILGASILGPHAGELIQVWGLAMSRGLKIGAIAGMIAPYPTFGEISKAAAGSFYEDVVFGPRARWLVRFLGRFG